MMVPSCTLVSSPISMAAMSARITAVGQTETSRPSVTSPETTAEGWMYGIEYERLEAESKAEVRTAIRRVGIRSSMQRPGKAEPQAIGHVVVEHGGIERQLAAGRRDPRARRRAVRTTHGVRSRAGRAPGGRGVGKE